MGLRVWLPLNGSLENQGLATVTTTNDGATSNTSGKIGNCYSFNGSSKITNAFYHSVTSAIGSLTCWVKFNALPASNAWYSLIQVGNLGGFATCRLGLYVEHGAGLNISINGSSTNANYTACSITSNVWYHICATFDGAVVTVYLDGNQIMSKTATVGSYATAASYIYVGGTSSYYLNGYMNDVRYYDHALSVKEVRELARGLMVHYKLDNADIEATAKITDCSGLKYHGTKVNTLSPTTDTSRYDRSTSFPGTSYIKRTSPSAQAMTISLWAKWNSIPSGQSVIYVDYKSKTGLGLMSTGILCSSCGLQSYTFSKASIVANTWYHFVIVCPSGSSNAARNLYINGVKQTATSNQSNWSYAIDELQLGKRSTTSDGFNGKLNDFRIYATALSDADILDLYNESAAIDRNGNYYSREVIEK